MKKAIVVKRSSIVEIIASVILIFFVHTFISSYIQLQSLKNMLAFYTLNTALVAWTMIISELIIIALIFLPRTRLVGFITAILSMIFAGIMILRFPHYPHDFGGIFNSIPHTQQWLLITVTAVLSLAGLILLRIKPRKKNYIKQEQQVVFT
jgi:hypothetical protein